MKESTLQKKVKKAIKERYGYNAWYYHPQDRVRRGVIDNILCFYGIFVAWELKNNLITNPLTPLQQYNIATIQRAGGLSFSADSVEGVIKALDYIKENYTLTKHSR